MTVKLTPKQTAAFKLLTNSEDLGLLYGGAKGGAKSFLACIWVKVQAEALIKLFGLKPTDKPLPVGFFGRKIGRDFRDTTLETFKRIIPQDHYRLADDEHEIIFHETVKVFCGGLDNQERIKKFNSAEFAFFAIDQAEETERGDVDVLQASLRLKINGIQPAYKQLYTANPADMWLKNDFIDAPLPRFHFIPALYTDNPHLPSNYGDTLDAAFRYSEPLLRAYKYGDWKALQATNTLITTVMLNDLRDVRLHFKEIRKIVSCDPSLGGDDCPIQVIENGKVVEEKILHERDPMKIAGEIVATMNRARTPYLSIDYSGGLGEAIASRVREVKPAARVYSLNSSESASEEDRFANLRAEMWWDVMQLIFDKKIPFPEDEELRRQLTSVRFKVVNSNGKIQLEDKKETKKRLGRSPDEADTFVMGNYKLGSTQPIVFKDAWDEESMMVEIGGGAKSAMTA